MLHERGRGAPRRAGVCARRASGRDEVDVFSYLQRYVWFATFAETNAPARQPGPPQAVQHRKFSYELRIRNYQLEITNYELGICNDKHYLLMHALSLPQSYGFGLYKVGCGLAIANKLLYNVIFG